VVAEASIEPNARPTKAMIAVRIVCSSGSRSDSLEKPSRHCPDETRTGVDDRRFLSGLEARCEG
jgi:hypothetical protein